MQLDRAKAAKREEEFQNCQANGALSDLWAEFVMNGSSAALAIYLKSGGDVNEQVRNALVSLLEELRLGNPGGEKPWRDYETFCKVEAILFEDRMERWKGRKLGIKPLSQRGALIEYAKAKNRTLRTVELQYNRGKRLFRKSTK